jgi:hypothetical protein
MLPVERIIGEEGLCATPAGLRLAMRLPWYRSLPFSTVEVAALTLDGAPVSLAEARVEYDAQSWTLAELGEATNAFWFVRDSAFLVVPGLSAQAGSEHEVALTLNVNPPYIPGMKRSNQQTAALRVA